MSRKYDNYDILIKNDELRPVGAIRQGLHSRVDVRLF